MTEPKTMKVKIEVVRKVWHSNTVEMTKREFERLSNLLDGLRHERKEAEETIASLCKGTSDNWQDDEVQDVAEFEPAIEEECAK